MCRVTSTQLESSLAAVADARTFVSAALRRWDLASLVMDAELLTSELVTNAVLHARSGVTVTVAVADGTAEIGVTDESTAAPAPRSPIPSIEGGRGLRLVDRVAEDWGVAYLDLGKQVWCRLDVGVDWAHRSSCPCGGDDLSRVRLESGRWAVAAPGPWDSAPGASAS
jgi:anti-sigma regulatory factor (Ser/Thr protein kinase)